MSEIAFAKQFLTSLDSRPTKLSSDHVADPRKLPAQSAYILPRIPKAFPPVPGSVATPVPGDAVSSAPSTANTSTVTLKPLRPNADTPPNVTIQHLQPKSTSIYDIKVQLAKRTGYAPDKLKLLWQKKPVGDSKTLQDLVGAEHAAELEMAVMYTGKPDKLPEPVMQEGMGAPESEKAAMHAEQTPPDAYDGLGDVEMTGTPTASTQHVDSGEGIMETDAFWQDLEGFVMLRCKDEAVAQRAARLFRQAWTGDR